MYPFSRILMITCLCLGLAACGSTEGLQREAKYPTGGERDGSSDSIYEKAPSILGDGGLSFGGKRAEDDEDGGSGIGVNSFLWRASLDTVSFMPIASADPFGGVIITDWYTPVLEEKDAAKERYKINVFILGKALRSDGVRVRIFRQVRRKGTWVDTAPSKDMARQIEDSILTRARQMRIAQIEKDN